MEELEKRGLGLIQFQVNLVVLAGFMRLRTAFNLRPSAMFTVMCKEALEKHDREQSQIRALEFGEQRQGTLPLPKPSAPPDDPPLPARPVIPPRVRGAIRTARANAAASTTPATSSRSSSTVDTSRKELPLEAMKRAAFSEGVLQGQRAGGARPLPFATKSLTKTKEDHDALLVVHDKLCVDGGWRVHVTKNPLHLGIAPREDPIFAELEAGFVSGLRAEVHLRKTSSSSSTRTSPKASTSTRTSTRSSKASTRSTPATSSSSSSTRTSPKASTLKFTRSMALAHDSARARGEHDGGQEEGPYCQGGKPTGKGIGEVIRYVRSTCSELVRGTLTNWDITEHYNKGFDAARARRALAGARKARTDKLYDLAEDLGSQDRDKSRAPTPARVREVVAYCRKLIQDTDASDRTIGERYADGYAPPVPAPSPNVQPGSET